MACQPIQGYFIPKYEGNAFITCLYLYLLWGCFRDFFLTHGLIKYQYFSNIFIWPIDRTLTSTMSWVWHKTASDDKALILKIWGVWSTLSLILLSALCKPRLVVSVRASSLGQMELLNHLQRSIIISYLKPYNCEQTNKN